MTTLAAADAAQADMRTLVIVGASTTRRIGRWVYTPRSEGAASERVAAAGDGLSGAVHHVAGGFLRPRDHDDGAGRGRGGLDLGVGRGNPRNSWRQTMSIFFVFQQADLVGLSNGPRACRKRMSGGRTFCCGGSMVRAT